MKASHSNTGAVARILIVEDFPAFRRFICSTLREKLDWRVIAEVSDGLEAVQKATELKPDLILLDIGLPTMNGIEGCSTDLQAFPRIQNSLLESGNFCRRNGGSS
jgi:CheY-like chemotaxis protein